MSEELQSISLYHCSGAKALVEPCYQPTIFASFAGVSSHQCTRRDETSLRLKFLNYPNLWWDHHEASVLSHKMFMELLWIQHRRGMQYLACADLNLRGMNAGTHFFQNTTTDTSAQHKSKEEQPLQEIACLQLANTDKIRVIQLPNNKQDGLGQTILKAWGSSFGAKREDKYGVRVYKLANTPWMSSETSKDVTNVAARKLIIAILAEMDRNGWSRVVPFQCTHGNSDADSIVFFQDDSSRMDSPKKGYCAISLEKEHKIRLIGDGLDEMTRATFESAIQRHRHFGITNRNRSADSYQIKLSGRPWCPHTTQENLKSAALVCEILQDLWLQGWRWHCALDLSRSVADKSTIFLSRRSSSDSASSRVQDDFEGGHIACVQPKGQGKVNLVSFPTWVLEKMIGNLKRATWCRPLTKVERHAGTMNGTSAVTCHFLATDLHRSMSTDETIVTAKIYTQLLKIVATVTEGVAMLGTCDISGNTRTERKSSSNGGHSHSYYPVDTDVFFFWIPSSSK